MCTGLLTVEDDRVGSVPYGPSEHFAERSSDDVKTGSINERQLGRLRPLFNSEQKALLRWRIVCRRARMPG